MQEQSLVACLRANKANGTLDVFCGKRVLDRLLAQSSGFEPGTRFGVKRPFFRDVQACAQEIGEQLVISVPLPLFVEPGQEHIAALELHQYTGAVGPSRERVAQRRAQALEYCGLP